MNASAVAQPAARAASSLAHSMPFRPALVAGAVVLAYPYSFWALATGLLLDTPLAYLGLVPLLAVFLAWARLARESAGRGIHDRQLDYIVGLALLGVAAGVALLLPPGLGSAFWRQRLDLLGIPPFVAGSIALLYGVRRLWTLRYPIAFLLLAWPIPYLVLAGGPLSAIDELTASTIGAINRLGPLASVTSDPTIFRIGPREHAFAINIGSPGVNGLVGFSLVAVGLLYVLHGSPARRTAWLLAGLGLVWLLSLARVEAAIVVGSIAGQQAALTALTRTAGLVFFGLAVLGAVVIAPRFGLHVVESAGGNAHSPASPVQRPFAPALLIISVALGLRIADAGLVRYEAIASDPPTSTATVPDFSQSSIPGWRAEFVASYAPAARLLLGPDASWDRMLYSSSPTAQLRSSVPIYVDVFDAADVGALSSHGIEVCYGFYIYQVGGQADVDLGSEVTGHFVSYTDQSLHRDWSGLWWEWPYAAYGSPRYQRVVVFSTGGTRAVYAGDGSTSLDTSLGRFAPTDQFLLAVGQQLVGAHIGATMAANGTDR
jgi:hypothetical protein